MKFKPTLFFFTLFLVLLGSLTFFFSLTSFHATFQPARSYEDAIQKFTAIEYQESLLPLSTKGHSRLLTHGNKTEQVFVLLHGLTSSPEQFAMMSKRIFELGANVVILRAKYAGFSNLLNKEQGTQTAQDLINQTTTSLDIASGLGKQITVVSISASALPATWIAQHYNKIDHLILISPFLGPKGWPIFLVDLVAPWLAHLPNWYLWKDKKLKRSLKSLSYVYPRFGTQSLGSALQLSKNIRCFTTPLHLKRLDIFFTAADQLVNNKLIEQQGKKWSNENPNKVFIFEFPSSMHISHDCIDPHSLQGTATIDDVYNRIFKTFTQF